MLYITQTMAISKKQIFYLLFLTVLGCNTDTDITTDNTNLIHFITHIQTLSTKSIITETTLPDNSQIGVFSWGHHKDEANVNTTLRNDLTNAKYTKETGSDELVPAVEAHYPINPDTLLNFYAYYPYVPSANSNPQSIPFNLKEQQDVMWATPVVNRGKSNSEERINLMFNHLLSAITIKFQKADDIQEEMTLQSIALENYSPAIQLNIQEGELTQSTSTTPFTCIENLSIPITTEQKTIVTDFLLCPVAKPVFIVSMSGKEYRIESSKAFESGKKQTYEFTIQAKDIHLSGSINPWIDGGSSNETVYF